MSYGPDQWGARQKKLPDLTGADSGGLLEPALLKIGLHEAESGTVGLHKCHVRRAAAQRLNSNRACTGIEVEHSGPRGAFTENGKKGFFHSVRCRPNGLSLGPKQPSAPMNPCDDAHDRIQVRAIRLWLRSERL